MKILTRFMSQQKADPEITGYLQYSKDIKVFLLPNQIKWLMQ